MSLGAADDGAVSGTRPSNGLTSLSACKRVVETRVYSEVGFIGLTGESILRVSRVLGSVVCKRT